MAHLRGQKYGNFACGARKGRRPQGTRDGARPATRRPGRGEAFVSTLTLQANYNAFVLPTLNVALLGDRLKSDTVEGTVSEKIG